MEPLRIVIADDEPIIRLDLRRTLENMGHIVIGEAGDGAQAVDGRHVYCTCDETGNVGGYPAIFAGLIRRVEYVLGSRVKLQ